MDEATGKPEPLPLRDVLKRRTLVVSLVSVTLFHFGNAAMLPMLGQVLAQTHPAPTRRRCRPASLQHSS